MHFTEYDTRLAAYALLTDEHDQILLNWLNGSSHAKPCWTLPGGGVEFDESIDAAVVREVFEVTGYRVNPGDVVATNHFTVDRTTERRAIRSQHFIFEARITGGTLGTVETGGTTDFARWVPLEDVPRLEPRSDVIDIARRAL